jgi:tripartite-type tricarboxylate transporter receptor subunit TctC
MGDFIYNHGGKIITVVLVLLLVLIVVSSNEKAKQWDAFSKTHECKLVREIKGSIGFVNTVQANGQIGFGTVTESDKKCYDCNNGVTYCR